MGCSGSLAGSTEPASSSFGLRPPSCRHPTASAASAAADSLRSARRSPSSYSTATTSSGQPRSKPRLHEALSRATSCERHASSRNVTVSKEPERCSSLWCIFSTSSASAPTSTISVIASKPNHQPELWTGSSNTTTPSTTSTTRFLTAWIHECARTHYAATRSETHTGTATIIRWISTLLRTFHRTVRHRNRRSTTSERPSSGRRSGT